MRYKLNHVEIVDPNSPWNRKKKDIIIANGIIRQAKPSDTFDIEIDAKNCCLLPALCETYASVGDPGYEYREDIESLSEAAAMGGVTAVCAIADNDPVTQNKTQVEYFIKKTKGNLVEIWPIGAITEGLQGKNPTEMYDMHYSGAVAFSDAPHAIKNSGVMLRALQYVAPFDGVVYSIPVDENLMGDGQVNEGEISVKMGMKGISNIAEHLQIYRDLKLLEYSGGKIHFSGVTTEDGVRQIREAKKKGLNVSASVYLHHLFFTDKQVEEFDTNFKVFPPLRTSRDQKALLKGIQEGTIDILSSQHIPLDTESKRLEFEYALPGMANIEYTFSLGWTVLNDLEKLVQMMSIVPRKLLNQAAIGIFDNAPANVILVNTSEEYEVKKANRKSKSINSPFIGNKLKGKVKAVFNNGQMYMNDSQ